MDSGGVQPSQTRLPDLHRRQPSAHVEPGDSGDGGWSGGAGSPSQHFPLPVDSATSTYLWRPGSWALDRGALRCILRVQFEGHDWRAQTPQNAGDMVSACDHASRPGRHLHKIKFAANQPADRAFTIPNNAGWRRTLVMPRKSHSSQDSIVGTMPGGYGSTFSVHTAFRRPTQEGWT